jgi:Fic family protein
MAAQINEEIIRRSIFGTAALEGNPLTEEKVEKILSEPQRIQKPQLAEKEIRNLKAVYDRVAELPHSDSPLLLTEGLIKDFHKLITLNLEYENNVPGAYRNHIVKVGDTEHGGVYTPPKCLDDIRNLMQEYVTWINSEALVADNPIIRAALAHYHFELIHPFGDANGRTGRIIEAAILQGGGVKYVPRMLSNFYYRNKDDYFRIFSASLASPENNLTAFLDFTCQGHLESLQEIKMRILFLIRKNTLRDYFHYLKKEKKISRRQFDLVNLLLDRMKPVAIEDLFTTSPFAILYRGISERTARRDLQHLFSLRLLLKTNGKYELNLRALD